MNVFDAMAMIRNNCCAQSNYVFVVDVAPFRGFASAKVGLRKHFFFIRYFIQQLQWNYLLPFFVCGRRLCDYLFHIQMGNKTQPHLEVWTQLSYHTFRFIFQHIADEHVFDVIPVQKNNKGLSEITTDEPKMIGGFLLTINHKLSPCSRAVRHHDFHQLAPTFRTMLS